MATYKHEVRGLTVVAIDERGEAHNLNWGGEPCATADDLRDFIRELCEQGAYSEWTRDDLLGQVGE